MKYNTAVLVLSHCLGVVTATNTACGLLGQQYPAPQKLSAEPKFQSATKQIDQILDQAAKEAPFNDISFSVGIFSSDEDGLLHQFHHTSPAVKNSTQGTRAIDADSVYRVGSVSKLLSVYLWLVTDGDSKFNDPISMHLPALAEYAAQSSGLTPDWDSITVGDLAGQMGGLARDYGMEDFAQPNSTAAEEVPAALAKAFPKLPQNEVPACAYLLPDGALFPCTTEEWIKGAAIEAPIFESGYTPAYSNIGFAIFGLALQNISGMPLEALFNKIYHDTLGMNSTYFAFPAVISDHDVLPASPTETTWNSELGVLATAGGFLSSLNDMATFGRSILSSQLLSKAMTNRWLKPTSFLDDFSTGVGRPWEIVRQTLNGQPVDIYTKGGDWGFYHSLFVLIPQYNIGFDILTARDPGPNATIDPLLGTIPNPILDTILPVIDEIAKEQAARNFAGTYVNQGTNSSMTIATQANTTALLVKEWTNNGVDLFSLPPFADPTQVWRIMPNSLWSGGKVGFTSMYTDVTPPLPSDIWYIPCSPWVLVDYNTYGNIPIGQMLFSVDDDGKSTSVELRALRTSLNRK